MAQKFEYYMWSPHPRAKLFKRYTAEQTLNLSAVETIEFENTTYVNHTRFKWVTEDTEARGDQQPMDGLLVSGGYMNVRTNTLYRIESGDIVMVNNEQWQVSGDIIVDYIYTPEKVQTYQHLALRRLV